MYKLTSCEICGSDIFASGGCCGDDQVLIFKCPCGQTYIDKLEGRIKEENIKDNKVGE